MNYKMDKRKRSNSPLNTSYNLLSLMITLDLCFMCGLWLTRWPTYVSFLYLANDLVCWLWQQCLDDGITTVGTFNECLAGQFGAFESDVSSYAHIHTQHLYTIGKKTGFMAHTLLNLCIAWNGPSGLSVCMFTACSKSLLPWKPISLWSTDRRGHF